MVRVIDSHGHVSAPPELYAYKAGLLSHRGAHGNRTPRISDERLQEAVESPQANFGGISHLQHLDDAGIGRQLVSPRPYQQMHSEQPEKIVRWFSEATNDVIARQCALYPDRFTGIAGLPQTTTTGPENCLEELERCVTELGFVGCILNPDPGEGAGPPPPGLGDEYWYPLYEKLVELDVPAIIHSAGCRSPREPYTLHFVQEETVSVVHLLRSSTFEAFPRLKIVVPHGGGAVPYQLGRFQAQSLRRKGGEQFQDALRRLYYDTCIYTKPSLELLIRTVGADRTLFGTEKPGTGSVRNSETGLWLDDVKAMIDDIDWLDDDARGRIYAGNAESVFRLKPEGVG